MQLVINYAIVAAFLLLLVVVVLLLLLSRRLLLPQRFYIVDPSSADLATGHVLAHVAPVWQT